MRLGWEDEIPSVGWGDLHALGFDEAGLKPHPAHALLALARALGLSLSEAGAWTQQVLAAARPARLWPQGALYLAVVEDTSPGVRAVQAAREQLEAVYAEPVSVHTLGLTRSPVKTHALAQTGARVLTHWAQVARALQAWGCP
ncbi:MAG: hypothetical protein GXO36_00315 [Chloroflexi bacterium]|nr:hypothetical protein [Chloroflexota bacterium]